MHLLGNSLDILSYVLLISPTRAHSASTSLLRAIHPVMTNTGSSWQDAQISQVHTGECETNFHTKLLP